jgi:hypothetical protein
MHNDFPKTLYMNGARGGAVLEATTNRKVAGSIPDGNIVISFIDKILPVALRPWGRLSF